MASLPDPAPTELRQTPSSQVALMQPATMVAQAPGAFVTPTLTHGSLVQYSAGPGTGLVSVQQQTGPTVVQVVQAPPAMQYVMQQPGTDVQWMLQDNNSATSFQGQQMITQTVITAPGQLTPSSHYQAYQQSMQGAFAMPAPQGQLITMQSAPAPQVVQYVLPAGATPGMIPTAPGTVVQTVYTNPGTTMLTNNGQLVSMVAQPASMDLMQPSNTMFNPGLFQFSDLSLPIQSLPAAKVKPERGSSKSKSSRGSTTISTFDSSSLNGVDQGSRRPPGAADVSSTLAFNTGAAMKAIRMGHNHAQTSSAYLGVTWYKASRRWQARLCCDNKKFHLGYFATEEEAARAYDRAVIEHKGPNAPRNFADSYPLQGGGAASVSSPGHRSVVLGPISMMREALAQSNSGVLLNPSVLGLDTGLGASGSGEDTLALTIKTEGSGHRRKRARNGEETDSPSSSRQLGSTLPFAPGLGVPVAPVPLTQLLARVTSQRDPAAPTDPQTTPDTSVTNSGYGPQGLYTDGVDLTAAQEALNSLGPGQPCFGAGSYVMAPGQMMMVEQGDPLVVQVAANVATLDLGSLQNIRLPDEELQVKTEQQEPEQATGPQPLAAVIRKAMAAQAVAGEACTEADSAAGPAGAEPAAAVSKGGIEPPSAESFQTSVNPGSFTYMAPPLSGLVLPGDLAPDQAMPPSAHAAASPPAAATAQEPAQELDGEAASAPTASMH